MVEVSLVSRAAALSLPNALTASEPSSVPRVILLPPVDRAPRMKAPSESAEAVMEPPARLRLPPESAMAPMDWMNLVAIIKPASDFYRHIVMPHVKLRPFAFGANAKPISRAPDQPRLIAVIEPIAFGDLTSSVMAQ